MVQKVSIYRLESIDLNIDLNDLTRDLEVSGYIECAAITSYILRIYSDSH